MAEKKNAASKPKRIFLGGRRSPGVVSGLAAVVMLAGVAFCLFRLVQLDLLPMTMVLLGALIVFLVLIIYLLLWWAKAKAPVSRIICGAVALAVGFVGFTGAGYLNDTRQAFEEVTNLTDKTAHTVSVVALKSENISSVKGLSGKKVGICSAADMEGTNQAVNKVEGETSVTFEEYPSVIDEVAALYNGEVSAILFPEEAREIVHEADGYFEFNTNTDVLDKVTYYTDRSNSTENAPDSVASITRDPFTILISGNDTYGSLEESSRSDVNMLVTINPKTSAVLITSIPRDAYAMISCKKNEQACVPAEDKLTHSGLDGVATTESTIEDLLGIEINYTVRVNFSSLVNLVDAMGGIDVEVPEGQEVETFYVNGTEGVHAGTNHLEGERALAFARERYAYKDGDNQRIRNQQTVITALIKKIVSPELLVRYPQLMEAIGTAFETNMPASQIRSFLQYEILRRPDWQIIKYAIAGESDLRMSAKLGAQASVTILNEDMKAAAAHLIGMMNENADPKEIEAYAADHSVESQGSKSLEEQRDKLDTDNGVYDYSYDYDYDDGYDYNYDDSYDADYDSTDEEADWQMSYDDTVDYGYDDSDYTDSYGY